MAVPTRKNKNGENDESSSIMPQSPTEIQSENNKTISETEAPMTPKSTLAKKKEKKAKEAEEKAAKEAQDLAEANAKGTQEKEAKELAEKYKWLHNLI